MMTVLIATLTYLRCKIHRISHVAKLLTQQSTAAPSRQFVFMPELNASLAQALGNIVNIPQFFIWRLKWNHTASKYDKTPATPDGPWNIDASLPANWLTYQAACARLETMRAASLAAGDGYQYALGWWLTAESGYWFLDLDGCVVNGQYTPIAAELIAQLPECLYEFSSSGTGLHIIGRGTLGPHSNRDRNHGLELYTHARGIAFGLSGEATGSADTVAAGIGAIAAQYFPPRLEAPAGIWNKARADWHGPTDDDVLISKARSSAGVAARMGQRATFAQLFDNAPELAQFYGPGSASERDAALAAHLAFWTGCDAPRMDRIMRRSALARDKWVRHKTYLSMTINNACARQRDVYRDKLVAPPALTALPAPQVPGVPVAVGALPSAPALVTPQPLVSAEALAQVENIVTRAGECGTLGDVFNTLIPYICTLSLPQALMPRVENAISERLELLKSKTPIADIRRAISRGFITDVTTSTRNDTAIPEWFKDYVFVIDANAFYNITNALFTSRGAFNGVYNRYMDTNNSGMHNDADETVLDRWHMRTVHSTMYLPYAGPIFTHDGTSYANRYLESSHPVAATAYTPEGAAAIETFRRHIQLMCNNRKDTFDIIMGFLAHNVQHPGVKVRWCPIIKGIPGDGKSTIIEVMRAVLGFKNVQSINGSKLYNEGGFNSWACGRVLVAIEELHFSDRNKHKIANYIKPYITNNVVDITFKGKEVAQYINVANQIAFTNHTDAVPIDGATDRRWYVVMTPFATPADLYKAIGVSDEREFDTHYTSVYRSIAREPEQWRKWFLEYPISALMTPNALPRGGNDSALMAAAGTDEYEQEVRNIIEAGGLGFNTEVVSTRCLSRKLLFTPSLNAPKTSTLHWLMLNMQYIKVEKEVKWNGEPHTIWVKPGVSMDNDNLRAILDTTKDLK